MVLLHQAMPVGHCQRRKASDGATVMGSSRNRQCKADRRAVEEPSVSANANDARPLYLIRRSPGASAPASAGGTDRDLAVPQFTQNCGAYNIIEF